MIPGLHSSKSRTQVVSMASYAALFCTRIQPEAKNGKARFSTTSATRQKRVICYCCLLLTHYSAKSEFAWPHSYQTSAPVLWSLERPARHRAEPSTSALPAAGSGAAEWEKAQPSEAGFASHSESILEKFFNFPSLRFFICINGDINIFCLKGLWCELLPFVKKRKFMFIFIFSFFFQILFPFRLLENIDGSPVLCGRPLLLLWHVHIAVFKIQNS